MLKRNPIYKGDGLDEKLGKYSNYWYNEVHIKWTNSYYVGTAGTVTAETITKYIEEQKSK